MSTPTLNEATHGADRIKTPSALLVGVLILAGATAHADDAVCGRIRAANVETGSAGGQMRASGYAFAVDTPKIYGLGTHTCSYLRDESVEGEVAAVYREQYRSEVGATDATIWISKTSGRVLCEEQDGDIVGKGKGHITYRWPAAKP